MDGVCFPCFVWSAGTVLRSAFSLSSQTDLIAAESYYAWPEIGGAMTPIQPNAGSASRAALIRVKRRNAAVAPENDAAIEWKDEWKAEWKDEWKAKWKDERKE